MLLSVNVYFISNNVGQGLAPAVVINFIYNG